jgi:hypothetical protein
VRKIKTIRWARDAFRDAPIERKVNQVKIVLKYRTITSMTKNPTPSSTGMEI